jgi:hypothetical protein
LSVLGSDQVLTPSIFPAVPVTGLTACAIIGPDRMQEKSRAVLMRKSLLISGLIMRFSTK